MFVQAEKDYIDLLDKRRIVEVFIRELGSYFFDAHADLLKSTSSLYNVTLQCT